MFVMNCYVNKIKFYDKKFEKSLLIFGKASLIGFFQIKNNIFWFCVKIDKQMVTCKN